MNKLFICTVALWLGFAHPSGDISVGSEMSLSSEKCELRRVSFWDTARSTMGTLTLKTDQLLLL